MQIACVLYPDFTMLDIVGPFNMLTATLGMEPVWVAEQAGPVVDHTHSGALVASAAFDEVAAPDIVVVPGGLHTTDHLDGPMAEWLRAVHPTTTWTTSVCTGSLVLAAAGLLDGLEATGHWAAMDQLASLGAIPTSQRVVMHPEHRIVTGAGVSAGIDMALALLVELQGPEAAGAAQLAIEYDPQPMLDSGSPEKADPAVLELLQKVFSGAI